MLHTSCRYSANVQRAYRYRFYPTVEQAVVLARTFGCVRYVYNRALAARAQAWSQRQERVTYVQTSAMLTAWKKEPETDWLGDVSSVPVQQSLRHLQAAYAAFWEQRALYPRFKSRKRHRDSAEYTRSGLRWREGTLTLAKMSEPLDIRWSRPLPHGAEPSTATVSRDPAGRWHVSILIDDPTIQPLARAEAVVQALVSKHGIAADRNALIGFARVLDMFLTLYMWILIARAVISWVSADPRNPIVRFLYVVTEPPIRAVRRLLPTSLRYFPLDIAFLVLFAFVVFAQYGIVPSIVRLGVQLQ